MKIIKYVPKKEVKEYKKEMIDALERTREILKVDNPYFSIGIVGSAKRNLVLRKGNSIYDVDIQLNVIDKDVQDDYRVTIKETLEAQLSNEWNLNQSTSVITAILHNEKSFDIALIKIGSDNERKVSKLGKKANNSHKDKWIWNEPKKSVKASKRVKTFKGDDWTKMRKEYKKLRENQWEKEKKDKKPSYALYVEAINNVYNQKNQGK